MNRVLRGCGASGPTGATAWPDRGAPSPRCGGARGGLWGRAGGRSGGRSGGRFWGILGLGWLALTGLVQAHQASDAFVQVQVAGQQLSQRVDVALRDLDRELVLDANDDGQLSWGEVRQRWPDIQALVQSAVALDWGDARCAEAAPAAPSLAQHGDGRHAVLQRRWTCERVPSALSLRYQLFETTDATHRGILQWRGAAAETDPAGRENVRVLVPGPTPVSWPVAGPGPGTVSVSEASAFGEAAAGDNAGAPAGWRGFVVEGVHHLLIGTDHILFLLALLLPAVLVWSPAARARFPARLTRTPGPAPTGPAQALGAGGRWQAADDGRAVAWEVARVVTAFTVAHAITLALAALGVFNPPARVVESVIAASVVLAALNNLWPVVQAGRWRLTFGFGLVHGFGFAGALQDLGLNREHLVSSLLGFNLGVELGQLAVVALVLPLAWGLRRTVAYRVWALRGGSALIALVAAVWLIERSLDLQLLPGA